MPLVGERTISAASLDAPLVPSLDTEQWEIPGGRILHVLYEIDDSGMTSLIPPALHPTIPPTVSFVITHVAESSFGPFTVAEVRIGCRSAVRPRAMLLRGYCDNPGAINELRTRWGYPLQQGEVTYKRGYDRVRGTVTVGGRLVLDCSLINPEPISGSDVQYIANLNLARIGREGGEVTRLIQVDPEYTFRSADRGRPHLEAFEAEAFAVPGCEPVFPVSASSAQCDITMPHLRYLVDPEKPPLQSVEKV